MSGYSSSLKDEAPSLSENFLREIGGSLKEKEAAPVDLEIGPGPLLDAPSEAGDGGDKEQGVDILEVVQLGAVDSIFFSRFHFPKTFRQPSPAFHREVWEILDDAKSRYVNVIIFRDGAKTTLLRTYTAKRIAYGISRTILYIGASERKAKQSVRWLRKQIEKNKRFCSIFGLSPGQPWTDEEIHIVQRVARKDGKGYEEVDIYVLAYGVTGGFRGINLDDYRPDLIVLDDILNDDNAVSKEARAKIENLVFGAIKESLSPESETPEAKLVMLNTPQDFEDVSQKALNDKQFRSACFGCWTKETMDYPLEMQVSIWEERYPSTVMRGEKTAAIARNTLSIFTREKECRLITSETSVFREEWVRFFGEEEEEKEPPLHEMWVVLVIDPVPPPSERELSKGLAGKDFEALAAIGRWRGKYYVLEMSSQRGHEPNWTVQEFFRLRNRWKPKKCLVETVAYQQTLMWLLKAAMKRQGRYTVMEEFRDKRSKHDRIVDGLSGALSEGQVYFRRGQTTLVSQVIHFSQIKKLQHDDEIEVVAIGVEALSQGFVGDVSEDWYAKQEEEIPVLEYVRGAP